MCSRLRYSELEILKCFYQLLLIVIISLIGLADSQTGTNVKDLRTLLFTTNAYDKKVRPATDQSLTTNVTVGFSLVSINAVDEIAEMLITTSYLSISWTDDYMTWTPSSYGNIQTLHIPQSDLWLPSIALQNSNNDYKALGDSSLILKISSTGTVTWSPFQLFTSSCLMNVHHFPFDTQLCSFTFLVWGYGKTDIYLLTSQSVIVLEDYHDNPTWDIVETSASLLADEDDSFVQFSLKIRRKPLYYIVSIILPALTLSILSVCVFLLPCHSGEKASFSVTMFLTFAVFLTIVSSYLPQNSESTPVISVYIVLLTVESTVITVLALIFIRVSSWDNNSTPVPNTLVKLLLLGPKSDEAKSMVKVVPINDERKEEEHTKTNDCSQEKNTNPDWTTVVNRLDMYSFVVFAFLTVFVTIVTLVICSTGEE